MNSVTTHSRWANVPAGIIAAGAGLIFLVGLIGSIDSVYALFTGHSLTADVTPPTIDSAFTSTATCDSTLIVPDAKVSDPEGGLLARRSGLALVQLYVGGERIGEWPIEQKDVKALTFKGPTYARRTTSEHEPVIAVAHDHNGNFLAKKLDGTYAKPLCFDAALSAKNGCTCGGVSRKEAGSDDKNDGAGPAPAQPGQKDSAPKPPNEKPPAPAAK